MCNLLYSLTHTLYLGKKKKVKLFGCPPEPLGAGRAPPAPNGSGPYGPGPWDLKSRPKCQQKKTCRATQDFMMEMRLWYN